MGSLFKKLITAASVVETMANAIKEDDEVKRTHASEEYQEELKVQIAELDQLPVDYLLKLFHDEYSDSWDGRGLVLKNGYNRMDPRYMAYREIFKKKDIIKVDVCCGECDRLLGFRMAPSKKSELSGEYQYELTHGSCNCRCGKSRVWEISYVWDGQDGTDPTARTHDLF